MRMMPRRCQGLAPPPRLLPRLPRLSRSEATDRPTTTTTGARVGTSAGGAFGASLWRGVKWAGRALDVGGGQERGARTGEASALERSIADRIAAKALVVEERAPS